MGPFDTAFDPLARFQYNFAIGSIVLEGFKAVFIDETKVRPIKEVFMKINLYDKSNRTLSLAIKHSNELQVFFFFANLFVRA